MIVSREPKVSTQDPTLRSPMHEEGPGTLLTIYDLKVRYKIPFNARGNILLIGMISGKEFSMHKLLKLSANLLNMSLLILPS